MSVYHNLFTEKVKENIKNNELLSEQNEYVIYSSFYSVAVSAFNWKNLPKDILIHLPEEFLTFWGMLAFFKDDNGEYKIYPCYPCGILQQNGLYDRYTIISKNGDNWVREAKDVEICLCNSLRLPTIGIIREMTKKTSYALSSVDKAIRKAAFGNLFACKNQEQVDALTELLDNYDVKSLSPFHVTLSEGFNKDEIKSFSIFDNRENDITSLWEVFIRYKNYFYSMFGVYNIEQTKGERLTEAESKGNQDLVRYTLLDDMYRHRKDFCDRVKSHFNYDLQVEVNRTTDFNYENLKKLNEIVVNEHEEEKQDELSTAKF